MGEYSAAANCFRVLFIIMNFVFVALGAGIIGVGGWLLYLGEENDYDVITGDSLVSGAALLVAAGCFTFLLAALGIISACGMWRPLLVIYILLVVLLVVVEIAAGIIGFVFRDEVSSEIESRVNETFYDYRSGPESPGYREEVNDAVAYIQETFECCGVNSSLDWVEVHPDIFDAEGQPPRECLCDSGEDNCEFFNITYELPSGADANALYYAWDRGCVSVVEDNLEAIAIGVGVLGIVIAVIEFFGIMVAIGLVVCIFKAKDDTFV